jgi:PTH1 family peptidyl-tRNA hydrolase
MEYMNKSGWAVSKLANFFKIESKDILVIHDEIDLLVGTVKLKFGGGLAGHNGLRDIALKLWTQDFWRIRIWVDRPSETSTQSVADYVLWNFKKEQIETIKDKYLEIEKFIFEFLGK